MEKLKVGFICVHNSCRSQIAEALCNHYAGDLFEVYSGGTAIANEINQDAAWLMKAHYQIDMEAAQHSKHIDTLPMLNIVITMGCNVVCPQLLAPFREDWGLDDPSGKSDDVFLETIAQIEANVKKLRIRAENGEFK